MSNQPCEKCQSTNYVKSGHTRGHQRYKCKECGCQFTDTKARGVNPALKSFAIVLYGFCGVSMGNIARIFKVSTVAVLKWVRAAAAQVEPQHSKNSAEIVMIDEFWHFVNGKKTKHGYGEPLMQKATRGIGVLGFPTDTLKLSSISLKSKIPGVSRDPLGWHLGNRSDASLQKLVKQVDTGKCLFVTDEWPGFFRLLPEERHFYGKDLTFPIEATNSDLRHRVARFHRRSKVTSRSLAMVQASLLLFHHLQSPQNLDDLLAPFLSFFS